MEAIFYTSLIFLLLALIVVLVVGLIKPAAVMRWSSKPSRLKVIGWWLLSLVVVSYVMVIMDETFFQTSEQQLDSARDDIISGNYSGAIGSLKKIKQDDVLYEEAQTLFAKVESLLLAGEAEKKAEAEAKAEERAAEAARKKEIADAKAAEKEARKKAKTEAKATTGGKSVKNPSKIASVEDGMNYLNGKTFVNVKAGEMWCKISFVNGAFTMWMQSPVKGELGRATFRGKYTVRESRYANTGERYWRTQMTSFELNEHTYAYNEPDKWREDDDMGRGIIFDITQSVLYYGSDYFKVKEVKSNFNPWN